MSKYVEIMDKLDMYDISVETALSEYDIERIKNVVKDVNESIVNEYIEAHENEKFVEYFSRTVRRYKANFLKVDDSTYFNGISAKVILAPMTKGAKKAFLQYAKNCKSYSNRQAVEKFNKMTGAEETNTFYTRFIKKAIYADMRLDFADNSVHYSAKCDKCVKLIANTLYAITHAVDKVTCDSFISVDAVENVLENPVETKTE